MMSVHLFLQFLNEIHSLDAKKQSILSLLCRHDETGMMDLLCDMCEIAKLSQYILPIFHSVGTKEVIPPLSSTTPVLKLTSFRGEPGSEIDYIKRLSEK